MSCDPTFEWCNELQADPTAAPADKAGAAPGAPAADDSAAGPKDAKKAKAGPPKAVVTKVAVKFVNAMWATMFARILSVGLQEWTRSTRQYSVQTTSVKAAMDLSTPYSSYKYSGWMLIGWGLYGWTAFLAKRFAKGSDIVKKMTLAGAQGTGVFGLALLGLAIWRTTGRDNCSTTSSWQCWYDSSPTDVETWKNNQYAQQSRTDYLLAFQMVWLSMTTTKFLSADLKFKEAQEKKAEEKKEDGAAPADGAAPKDGPDAPAGPGNDKAPKLVKMLEYAAWGL